ncbi:aminotransferase class III-fold pyridoxal phosphate-dependent enzyme [Bradyrhizobium lablabi]|uniref:aminotransferase class III-fold pyridoxal phosphate-dependent enzyme n=1 Tax=Bradyrhizobium lablabi TaxID=722472 RepID=UPI001BADDE15|nr:aminotransferase class III-fold pyridoxal phosphate-dependent enzyme [Bradyrhizobium lablabi]MBR1123501.1 aminotransferase class III-fold pyridoxal phosphate-dependent enzyme [Bradyrhizobium lablabi]
MTKQAAVLSETQSADAMLRERARRVVPGGMWGHLNAARLPAGYPQFFASAEGCRVRDVDGREYIDFMCSWGPVLLGHRHPDVEAAVRAQAALGDCLNGPGEVMVDLAEDFVAMLPHADWVMFQKNGGDATTACVTIARAATSRRKVLVARGSYHGALPWCTPSVAGVTTEDRAHLLHFEYNDVASLRAAVDQAGKDLATILVTAFRHDMGRDLELPTAEFAAAVRHACDDTGAALIIDEVRTGLRLDIRGSWETLGVRPDLCAWSKAIANGYALAAVSGNDRFREAATKVFVTGSFWCGTVAMAAARATLRIARETDVPAYIRAMGLRLREGLASLADRHGIAIRQSGPPQMPLMLFDDDPEVRKGRAFCSAALRHGAFLHPQHNMFLSAAHGPSDIDAALEAASHGFKAVRELRP